MKLCGLQKTTLLDFPGRVAATIFTGGCNFSCPFCHNSGLLGSQTPESYNVQDVLDFLTKRRHILEGVCITGGEPTLQPDLEEFIVQIRALGLAVKLDTNGYRPDVLQSLCQKSLLDFVAMDIKAGRSHYSKAAGVSGLFMEQIDESIQFLKSGAIPYEFRTTAVKGIHTAADFREIGPWISGCHDYYIQNFSESGQVLVPNTYSPFSRNELAEFAALVHPYVNHVGLRGIDF